MSELITKYVLDYLREEMYITPVEYASVAVDAEWSDSECEIGYRLIINDKDTDIVVWYGDLFHWLIKKHEKTITYINKA